MKRFLCLFLSLALLLCLSGCSLFEQLLKDEPEPQTSAQATQSVEQMLERCLAACNNVDVEGILDCVSPRIAKPVRTMLKLVDSLTNVSDEELLESIISLLGAEDTDNAEQVCKTLSAEVTEVSVDGDKAKADVSFAFEQGDCRYSGDTTVSCICVDGRWYISMLSA